jgi:hypothetical protein
MALREALFFLQQLMGDSERLAILRATPPHNLLAEFMRMGGEAGCAFTVDELQAAYARDCMTRWLRYAQFAHRPDER